MLTFDQKQARMQGIGGSDAAAVVGLSPYKTPFQLFMEKTGQAPSSDEESEAMLWGSILEEPIAEEYARRTQRKIRRQPMIISDTYPFMRVNLDRQIIGEDRGPGVLEVKSYGEWSARHVKGVEELPDHVYIQVQHALAVTGYAWGSVAMLIGGQRFIFFDVERHDQVIEELIRQEAEFWERVRTLSAPPIDGTQRTAELLKRLYPTDTGKVLTCETPELIEAAHRLVLNKSTLKILEAENTALENRLKSAIGDASEIVLPTFGSISWKRAKDSTRPALDIDKLKSDYSDAYAACLGTNTIPGSRRFLLKPTKE